MEISGHGRPPGAVAGSGDVYSVHGQPDLTAGGGGNSLKRGQCIFSRNEPIGASG